MEAMSEEVLALAPGRGGRSDYISPGRTGYLIGTESPAVLLTDLEHSLRDKPEGEERLKRARRGRRTIQERFEIGPVSRRFARISEEILSPWPPP